MCPPVSLLARHWPGHLLNLYGTINRLLAGEEGLSWCAVYNVSRAPSTCAPAFRIHGKNCFVVANVPVTGRVIFCFFFFIIWRWLQYYSETYRHANMSVQGQVLCKWLLHGRQKVPWSNVYGCCKQMCNYCSLNWIYELWYTSFSTYLPGHIFAVYTQLTIANTNKLTYACARTKCRMDTNCSCFFPAAMNLYS